MNFLRHYWSPLMVLVLLVSVVVVGTVLSVVD